MPGGAVLATAPYSVVDDPPHRIGGSHVSRGGGECRGDVGSLSADERASSSGGEPRPRRPALEAGQIVQMCGLGWLARKRAFPVRIAAVSASRGSIVTQHALREGEYVHIRVPAASGTGSPGDSRGRLLRGRVVHELAQPEQPGWVYEVEWVLGFGELLKYCFDRAVPWLALIASIIAMATVVSLKGFNVYYFWYHPIVNTYSILVTLYILSRVVIAAFYSPPADSGYRPPVTVVVACKNEEKSIGRTIECICQSDYPQDRLEVIAVDDGSTDETLAEMHRMRERFPAVKIISFDQNRGKRQGMREGALIATGEVLVFIDSDTFVRRDAIARLASAFVDPEIGAVCGHANVLNCKVNFLTKMQEVRYYVAFRILKSAESVFSAVTCCSGCLAAYRRQFVMENLDLWSNQRFMGQSATFGDDRSLTNYMLRRNRVVYHSEAVCSTAVPESLSHFLRQQLRWKKSWVRESLIAATFMWKRHPGVAFFFYLGVLFPLIAPLVVLCSLVLPWLGMGHMSWLYVYGTILMATLYGLLYLVKFRNSFWIYGIVFSMFYMLFLVWQTYYALATLRRNHWGTR